MLGAPRDGFGMADLTKGTDSSIANNEKDNSWYIVTEAECTNDLDSFESIFEESTDDSVVSDLIDDVDNASQGNSLALYNDQCAERIAIKQ